MHAVVGVFTHDPTRRAEQDVELHERIIPMVEQLTGLVSGYWSFDRVANTSHAHLVFDSAEAAEKLAAFVGSEPRRIQGKRAGVECRSLTVTEVIGHVQRGNTP
jgi:hypothetical protein